MLYDTETWRSLSWGPFHPNQDGVLRALMPDMETRKARLVALNRHVARCLAHARTFHRALDRPAEPPKHGQVHVFAGDARATRSVLSVHPETGEVDWIAGDPGDGAVTRQSALGQSRSRPEASPRVRPITIHFNGGEHLGMLAEPEFLDQALYLLLEAPDPPMR